MGICTWRCLQRGLCLAAISMPVLSPAGAAAAGIKVWLEKGAHVGMSGARPAGLVWHGVLQGVCHVLCQIGLAFPRKCVASAPGTGLSPAQPCRSGAAEVARPRQTCDGVELLTANPAPSSPGIKVCLEMLQYEGFGVTKERCECVCTLGAFTAPCTRLNGKFYLLGTGSALNFMGTAAPLVLPLEGWHVWVMPLGAVG